MAGIRPTSEPGLVENAVGATGKRNNGRGNPWAGLRGFVTQSSRC